MSSNAPIEGKVWAGAAGTGAGATLTVFFLWVIGVVFFHALPTSDAAADAILAVPFPITGVVGLFVTVGGGLAAAYKAKHTPRPPEDPATYEVDENDRIEDSGPVEVKQYPISEYPNLRDVEPEFNDHA